MSDIEFHIIPATSEHVSFVAGSWLKSMRLSPEFRNLTDDVYYTWAKKHVAKRLQVCDGWVAVDEFNPDVVVGYLIYSGTNLEWTYIRRDFRKLGLFKRMIGKTNVETFSHRSTQWRPGQLLFRPWYLDCV